MRDLLNKFIERYGVWTLVRLPFYPITLLLWGPYRLVATLWNARVLASGKWSSYIGFSPIHSINNLFYWTQAVYLRRHGRNGYSNTLGLGDFFLGRWFHLSLPATYLYMSLGALLPIFSMFAWLAMHLLWLDVSIIEPAWFAIVLFLASISTKFYANTFIVQNYNLLGWMFFPLGVWAMLEGYPYISAMAWFMASFGSITVVVIAGFIACVGAVWIADLAILLSVVPASLKVFSHLYWPMSDKKTSGSLRESTINMARTIGASSSGVKYKRSSSKTSTITFAYYSILYFQYLIAQYIFIGFCDWYVVAGVIVFIINSQLVRFADFQSMWIMMFTLLTASVLQQHEAILLISYWFAISPLPILSGSSNRSSIDMPAPLSPYNIDKLLCKITEFLDPVPPGKKILFAFDNPKNQYEKIFDGYRIILEAPCYIASIKGIHLMPDWNTIVETNYLGAPEYWGRDIQSVNTNVGNFDIDYVIAYQDSGTDLDISFETSGYKVVNELEWEELASVLQFEKMWTMESPPKWWLLSVPRVWRDDK